MAVLLMCGEPGTGRVANWHTRKYRFSKNIKKSGPLIIGDKGLNRPSSRSSLIVLLVIKII
jgi:hypothetical protein